MFSTAGVTRKYATTVAAGASTMGTQGTKTREVTVSIALEHTTKYLPGENDVFHVVIPSDISHMFELAGGFNHAIVGRYITRVRCSPHWICLCYNPT